jgi:hypothetical protein
MGAMSAGIALRETKQLPPRMRQQLYAQALRVLEALPSLSAVLVAVAALGAGCQVATTRESADAITTGAQATSGGGKDGSQWP